MDLYVFLCMYVCIYMYMSTLAMMGELDEFKKVYV